MLEIWSGGFVVWLLRHWRNVAYTVSLDGGVSVRELETWRRRRRRTQTKRKGRGFEFSISILERSVQGWWTVRLHYTEQYIMDHILCYSDAYVNNFFFCVKRNACVNNWVLLSSTQVMITTSQQKTQVMISPQNPSPSEVSKMPPASVGVYPTRDHFSRCVGVEGS